MLVANISLGIFSIILSLIPVVYTLNNQRYRQRLNQYFLGISISNILMILGDLSDWTFQSNGIKSRGGDAKKLNKKEQEVECR